MTIAQFRPLPTRSGKPYTLRDLEAGAVFEYLAGEEGCTPRPTRVEIVHVGRWQVFYRRHPTHPMGTVGETPISRFLAIVNLDSSRLVAAATATAAA